MAAPETSGAQTNGTQSTQPRSALDADIALLQSLLSQEHNDEPESDLDVAEILKRLETADGIAAGLESRLDGIMGSIDSMLGALEPACRARVGRGGPGRCCCGGSARSDNGSAGGGRAEVRTLHGLSPLGLPINKSASPCWASGNDSSGVTLSPSARTSRPRRRARLTVHRMIRDIAVVCWPSKGTPLLRATARCGSGLGMPWRCILCQGTIHSIAAMQRAVGHVPSLHVVSESCSSRSPCVYIPDFAVLFASKLDPRSSPVSLYPSDSS
ncbi:uncharacterized protein B0H18DRAFT_174079 [Fomitopsis serialis]|uniref:uncharacterized protein n=1 Tax=Fomitopsis serialis TaxID=139415 RepID=UPI002008BF98|nr:uncharacterized protein B0H18DRAFT_174079 [Neoantrodia serialis]KAH9929768.1 hypothetical protein B0H18DRAFT_174079 [Neoantrodia serialis]